MAEQDDIQALTENNQELVGWVQDYQGQIAEKTFQLVQANGNVRKLQSKLGVAEEALRQANARIEELEAAATPEKAKADSK